MDRQVITVDIAPGSNAQQRLMVSQGDIGRPLGVRIIQNGLPLNCTGYTAHLYVLKPDHNYYECTCTISNNNLISWDTAEQETPVAGECLAEIRITSGTNDIGTACFVEYVEASPADLGYASESLISSMTEYVDAAQQAAEEAEQVVADVDNVNDVAVDASGHIVLTKVLGSTVESDETVLQPGDIENDLLATTAGKVLDARQGKALKDLIGDIVYVNLSPATQQATLAAAVEAVWSQIPTGKAFVGRLNHYGNRFISGYKYPASGTSYNYGSCIVTNYDGDTCAVCNNNGTFTTYPLNNRYKQITVTTTSTDVSSIYAYVENGVVQINVTLAIGLSEGWHNDIALSIDNAYKSRASVYGAFRIGTANDANKVFIGQINGGTLQLYIPSSNAGAVAFSFVYPLKTS